jgi:hypothetical protein
MDSAHILAFADIPSKEDVKAAIMDTLKATPPSLQPLASGLLPLLSYSFILCIPCFMIKLMRA